MTQAYKGGNFITAASFARRLLDLPDSSAQGKSELHNKAQTVLQKSEQKARNEFKLNYDERNPFEINCKSLDLFIEEVSLNDAHFVNLLTQTA